MPATSEKVRSAGTMHGLRPEPETPHVAEEKKHRHSETKLPEGRSAERPISGESPHETVLRGSARGATSPCHSVTRGRVAVLLFRRVGQIRATNFDFPKENPYFLFQ